MQKTPKEKADKKLQAELSEEKRAEKARRREITLERKKAAEKRRRLEEEKAKMGARKAARLRQDTRKVWIGKVPIMLCFSFCILYELSDEGLYDLNKCFFDSRGYQQVRWEEAPCRLWLYDNDPRDKQVELILLMTAPRARGFSWKDDFDVHNGTFPRVAVTAENDGMLNHGVSVGECEDASCVDGC
ncbi:uncharacterized protein LAESUDRAFT_765366 [Laetiporus sulphureus 93-53]|uniref:DNA-directed RNA polymerase n=1 Tax=Laetiporus sulphureus 93-53 TaxID=1314785 RepID=A0A165AT18_9APHY|nr:uncharacterized protein LAESUDRAFT_765366 [Laetiporus sulphureus 93-53]KZS99601.1 hypothetical protein LAESUDRAFT_765366 [Laetiporus sulphureus 93-53]